MKVVMKMGKSKLETVWEYMKAIVKWMFFSITVGFVGGGVGCVFHKCLDFVAHTHMKNNWLVYLLPVGGMVIAFLYWVCKKWGKLDTNCVIEAAREERKIPLIMAPLIFVSTLITHFLGGSAGREGAALQLGGSIGFNIGKVFKLKENDSHIIVMAGMSSVFAALFGTPLTAAMFAIEVVSVGTMCYAALVPCLFASIIAYNISTFFGNNPVFFEINTFEFSAVLITKVIVLAALCAILCIFFCIALKKSEHYMKKFISNSFIRGFAGGCIIILLTLIVNCRDYNGAGMNIIEQAMRGVAKPEAFVLKILFTAVTIASGFKGGEIVPTFFVGSTFGCIVGGMLGIDPALGAAIGFVSLFCGVVNCPFASIILAFEVFGGDNYILFAIACGISFMLSGDYGLYKSQKIAYSRIDGSKIDINTK